MHQLHHQLYGDEDVQARLKMKGDFRERMVRYMNPFCSDKCISEVEEGKLQCDCGVRGLYEWTWDVEGDTSISYSKDTREIVFHPVYSSGTAALRGATPFLKGRHYYWEMKMMSALYGTDVMIGVGTSKIRIADWRFRFFSLLGYDANSWGYSYNGSVQHDGSSTEYGSKFGLGSLVGVHLDMCIGTLEFYLNRKPLGIAFTGLSSKELYPMVCSTAAHSAMKMSCAISFESSLQLKCMQCISKNPQLLEEYRKIPGLARLLERRFFWLINKESTGTVSPPSPSSSDDSSTTTTTTTTTTSASNRSNSTRYFLRPSAKKIRYC